MRFVERESGEALRLHEARHEAIEEIRHQQTLGREVEQLDLAAQRSGQTRTRLARRKAGIDEARRDAVVRQQAHLVLHEGDQGRDDDHHAWL